MTWCLLELENAGQKWPSWPKLKDTLALHVTIALVTWEALTMYRDTFDFLLHSAECNRLRFGWHKKNYVLLLPSHISFLKCLYTLGRLPGGLFGHSGLLFLPNKLRQGRGVSKSWKLGCESGVYIIDIFHP